MFNINDYVVYKKDVCKVIDIKNIKDIDYYVLVPVCGNSLKISDIDDKYFNMAEKYLYKEFAIVLNMTYEDTKNYVIKMVDSI